MCQASEADRKVYDAEQADAALLAMFIAAGGSSDGFEAWCAMSGEAFELPLYLDDNGPKVRRFTGPWEHQCHDTDHRIRECAEAIRTVHYVATVFRIARIFADEATVHQGGCAEYSVMLTREDGTQIVLRGSHFPISLDTPDPVVGSHWTLTATPSGAWTIAPER